MTVIVVIAPATSWRPNRGFRHAVAVGEKRTLCGRDADNWQGDVRSLDGIDFVRADVGCRVCIRVFHSRGG